MEYITGLYTAKSSYCVLTLVNFIQYSNEPFSSSYRHELFNIDSFIVVGIAELLSWLLSSFNGPAWTQTKNGISCTPY